MQKYNIFKNLLPFNSNQKTGLLILFIGLPILIMNISSPDTTFSLFLIGMVFIFFLYLLMCLEFEVDELFDIDNPIHALLALLAFFLNFVLFISLLLNIGLLLFSLLVISISIYLILKKGSKS